MISILITLVILGVILYLVNLIPMPDYMKRIIQVVAVLFVVLWLLQALGLWSGMPGALRR